MVHWFDELPSTQDVAHRMAAEGVPHGTAVAARIQTAGRGTRGRAWISNEGGLWLSVICRPEGQADLPVLGVRIGMALAEQIESLLPPGQRTIRIKWPNDLLLDGAKLGGILCEARWHGDRLGWMTAGIGLNLHNPLPESTGFPVTRLADAGSRVTAADLAEAAAALVASATRRPGPLDEAELAAFAARDWLRDRAIVRPLSGTGAGITPRGQLLIRAPDGTVHQLDDSWALQVA